MHQISSQICDNQPEIPVWVTIYSSNLTSSHMGMTHLLQSTVVRLSSFRPTSHHTEIPVWVTIYSSSLTSSLMGMTHLLQSTVVRLSSFRPTSHHTEIPVWVTIYSSNLTSSLMGMTHLLQSTVVRLSSFRPTSHHRGWRGGGEVVRGFRGFGRTPLSIKRYSCMKHIMLASSITCVLD